MKIKQNSWYFEKQSWLYGCRSVQSKKYKKKILGFNKKIRTKLAFPPQQKTDTTAQLCCTLSTYVTPKIISCQIKKLTQHHNCIVLWVHIYVVCKTKTYFPPEQKLTEQHNWKKGSSSPRVASVFVSLSVFLSVSKVKRVE